MRSAAELSEWRGKKLQSVIPGQPMPGSDEAEAVMSGEVVDGR